MSTKHVQVCQQPLKLRSLLFSLLISSPVTSNGKDVNQHLSTKQAEIFRAWIQIVSRAGVNKSCCHGL